MRHKSTWWIIALVMLILDFYVYQAVKAVSTNATERTKNIIHYAYWTFSIATIAIVLSVPYFQLLQTNKFFRNYVFAILVGLLFAKII